MWDTTVLPYRGSHPSDARYIWDRRSPHINFPDGHWIPLREEGHEDDQVVFPYLPALAEDGTWWISMVLIGNRFENYPPMMMGLDDFLSRFVPSHPSPGIQGADLKWKLETAQ